MGDYGDNNDIENDFADLLGSENGDKGGVDSKVQQQQQQQRESSSESEAKKSPSSSTRGRRVRTRRARSSKGETKESSGLQLPLRAQASDSTSTATTTPVRTALVDDDDDLDSDEGEEGEDEEEMQLRDAVATLVELQEAVEQQRRRNGELEAKLREMGGGDDKHILEKILAAEQLKKGLAADLDKLQQTVAHLNQESEKASAALLSEEGMTVEFKRNIEKWITDLKDEVASLKEQEQKYATCMDELVEEGMAKARAKADADRAKYEAQLEAAEGKTRELREKYEYESDVVENFDQKEADLARSIESHVAETQRAQDEIKQLKKDVMKHRKRGKDLANELGRLQGETSNTELEASHERRTAETKLAEAEADALGRQEALEQEVVSQHELVAVLRDELEAAQQQNAGFQAQKQRLNAENAAVEETETRLAALLVEVAAASRETAETQSQLSEARKSQQAAEEHEEQAAARRKALEEELVAAATEDAAMAAKLQAEHRVLGNAESALATARERLRDQETAAAEAASQEATEQERKLVELKAAHEQDVASLEAGASGQLKKLQAEEEADREAHEARLAAALKSMASQHAEEMAEQLRKKEAHQSAIADAKARLLAAHTERQENLDKLQSDAKDLEASIATEEQLAHDLEHSAHQEAAAAETELKIYQEKLEHDRLQFEEQAIEVTNLEAKLADQQKQREEAESQHTHRMSGLEQERDSIMRRLDEARQQHSVAEGELTELNSSREQLEVRLAELEAERKLARSEFQQRSKAAQQQHAESQSKMEEKFRKELEELQKAAAATTDGTAEQLLSLREQHNNLVTASQNAHEERLGKLQAEAEAARQQARSVLSELESTEAEVASVQQRTEALKVATIAAREAAGKVRSDITKHTLGADGPHVQMLLRLLETAAKDVVLMEEVGKKSNSGQHGAGTDIDQKLDDTTSIVHLDEQLAVSRRVYEDVLKEQESDAAHYAARRQRLLAIREATRAANRARMKADKEEDLRRQESRKKSVAAAQKSNEAANGSAKSKGMASRGTPVADSKGSRNRGPANNTADKQGKPSNSAREVQSSEHAAGKSAPKQGQKRGISKLNDKNKAKFIADVKKIRAVAARLLRPAERIDCTEKADDEGPSGVLMGLHDKDSTELIDAVEDADTEAIYNLVLKGCPVNGYDEDGYSPLIMAACCGHVGIAHLLLEMGARVNMAGINRATPLHVAVQANFPEIADLVLDCRPNLFKTMEGGGCPLYIAAQEGHRWAIQDLLESKADPNQRNDAGQTPLHAAVQNGHVRVVKALLDGKANPSCADRQGTTPLVCAVHQHGEASSVRPGSAGGPTPEEQGSGSSLVHMLLENGADLDVGPVVGNIQAARSTGQDRFLSPLLVAAAEGKADIATQLLEAGADPNASVLGITPLLLACHPPASGQPAETQQAVMAALLAEGSTKRAKAWSAACVYFTLHGQEDERLEGL